MPQVLEAVSQLRLAAAEAACFQPEATEAPWWADPAAAVIVAAPRQALAREVGSAMVELPRLTAAAEAAAGTAAVPQPVELQEDLEMMLVVEEVHLICLDIMDAL